MLRRDGEERKGGLQIGGKNRKYQNCHDTFIFIFCEVDQRKPMHLGSKYLIPSKPKDFPIHFMCTYICVYMYIYYIYIYLGLSLAYIDICMKGDVHLQKNWPFSGKSNWPQPNTDTFMAIQNQLKCFSSEDII